MPVSASITRPGACGLIRSCLTTRRWAPAPQGAKSAPTSRQAGARTRRVSVVSCAIARRKSRLDEHVFVCTRANMARRPHSSSRRPRPSPLSRQKCRCLLWPHSRRERPRGRCRRRAHRWVAFEDKRVGCHPDGVAYDTAWRPRPVGLAQFLLRHLPRLIVSNDRGYWIPQTGR